MEVEYYIYRYVHPNYPYLYIGQTTNLKTRIKSHDTNNGDNIDRQYTDLLQQSEVLFFKVNGKSQMDYIESYLIDKYKPYLNKAKKKPSQKCDVEMTLPEWQLFKERDNRSVVSVVTEKDFLDIVHQTEKKVEESQQVITNNQKIISELEDQIQNKKKELNETIAKINLCNKSEKNNNSVDDNSLFVSKEFIEDFYTAYPNSDITFTSKIYSESGKAHIYTLDKNKMSVLWEGKTNENPTPMIYYYKTEETKTYPYDKTGAFHFVDTIGTMYFGLTAQFNEFKPSSPLCLDLLNAFYASKLLKVKEKYYYKLNEMRIIPYKDISINDFGTDNHGNIRTRASFIIVNEIVPIDDNIFHYIHGYSYPDYMKDSSRLNASHICEIGMEIDDNNKIEWDVISHGEYKLTNDFRCGTFTTNQKRTQGKYTKLETDYYNDLSLYLEQGDFLVLNYELFRDAENLKEVIGELVARQKECLELYKHKP